MYNGQPTDPAAAQATASARAGSIEFVWRDGVPCAVLVGDIDFSAGHDVDDALLEKYRTEGLLVADLGQVTFLDSTGISLLLRLRQVAAEVRLDRVPARVRRMLELTGVDSLFSYGS